MGEDQRSKREIERRIAEANLRKPTRAMIQDHRPISINKNIPVRNVRPPAKFHGERLNRPTTKTTQPTSDRPNFQTVPSDIILITGSIGDFLAIESHFSESERASIRTVCYATQKDKEIREIFAGLPIYQNVNHMILWDNFSDFFCFFSKDDLRRKLQPCPDMLLKCTDFSIALKFPEIKSRHRVFTGSSTVRYKLADISKFNLPDDYSVICPYSTDKRSSRRDFTHQDWSKTLSLLEEKNRTGVVLNKGKDIIPEHPRLVDLSNSTFLGEAIEITKKAKGYIGIDSCLSVIAAQLFGKTDLAIKTVNQHLITNATIYYAPHREISFLRNEI